MSSSSITSTLINENSIPDNENEKPEEKLGYQLRALTENISALKTDPWSRATAAQNLINVTSLSSELVNETLNYFVNCGQRLSQMTKTYDDNDAYLLLLQEKEVDLELAARIGQDLLKQNKQLRDSIKNLETELVKRQDDVQQLKHELASKTSLLDTFIEEEEQQTTLDDCDDDSSTPTNSRQQDLLKSIGNNNTGNKNLTRSNRQTPDVDSIDDYDENGNGVGSSGFLSLNYINQKSLNPSIEPFSSLPYNLITSNAPNEHSSQSNSKQHISNRDESNSVLNEDFNDNEELNDQQQQQKLIQTVTSQLVESNKRLCELQDEIFFKSEQYTNQQEKIFKLHEQLKDTEKRLSDLAQENETLKSSVSSSLDCQKELNEELKVCKKNFSELLDAFLELQKETRLFRQFDLQKDSNLNYFDVMIDPLREMQNISFDHFYTSNQTSDEKQTMPKRKVAAGNMNKQLGANNITINHQPIESNLRIDPKTSAHEDEEPSRRSDDDSGFVGNSSRLATGGRCTRASQQACSSLLDEIKECMQKEGKSSSNYLDDSSDGDDSGVHTERRGDRGRQATGGQPLGSGHTTAMSFSPSINGLATDNDDEDYSFEQLVATSGAKPSKSPDDESVGKGSFSEDPSPEENSSRAKWLGITSFMFTTLLILCLSVAMSPSSNLNNLTQRIQLKLDK